MSSSRRALETPQAATDHRTKEFVFFSILKKIQKKTWSSITPGDTSHIPMFVVRADNGLAIPGIVAGAPSPRTKQWRYARQRTGGFIFIFVLRQ